MAWGYAGNAEPQPKTARRLCINAISEQGTGIYKQEEIAILDVKTGDIGRYTAIISKELVRQQYGDEGMIDYYIGLKGAQNMSEEEATNYANTLAQQLKISDDNVIVRSTYFNLKDENHGSDMLFYFLIGFVTFIGSGIVIYSIFIFQ